MTGDVLHLRPPQSRRLARFGVPLAADVHCHCLPGLDDGPATLDEAVALCRLLVEDGTTAVIATPHQLGPFAHVTADAIWAAAGTLADALSRGGVPLRLKVGAELRVDEHLLGRLLDGQALALPDGGAYVLVELPHSTMLDLRPLVEELGRRGLTPVIAHPERVAPLAKSPRLLGPWIARGAVCQVTAGSLLGEFGPAARQAAWAMMDLGWVSVVASDAHDVVGRAPSMTAAIDAVAGHAGHAVARRLCVTNPAAVYEGRAIVKPRAPARG